MQAPQLRIHSAVRVSCHCVDSTNHRLSWCTLKTTTSKSISAGTPDTGHEQACKEQRRGVQRKAASQTHEIVDNAKLRYTHYTKRLPAMLRDNNVQDNTAWPADTWHACSPKRIASATRQHTRSSQPCTDASRTTVSLKRHQQLWRATWAPLPTAARALTALDLDATHIVHAPPAMNTKMQLHCVHRHAGTQDAEPAGRHR